MVLLQMIIPQIMVQPLENGTNPRISPYYGEIPYAGRMITTGFNYGVYKVLSHNWIAY